MEKVHDAVAAAKSASGIRTHASTSSEADTSSAALAAAEEEIRTLSAAFHRASVDNLRLLRDLEASNSACSALRQDIADLRRHLHSAAYQQHPCNTIQADASATNNGNKSPPWKKAGLSAAVHGTTLLFQASVARSLCALVRGLASVQTAALPPGAAASVGRSGADTVSWLSLGAMQGELAACIAAKAPRECMLLLQYAPVLSTAACSVYLVLGRAAGAYSDHKKRQLVLQQARANAVPKLRPVAPGARLPSTTVPATARGVRDSCRLCAYLGHNLFQLAASICVVACLAQCLHMPLSFTNAELLSGLQETIVSALQVELPFDGEAFQRRLVPRLVTALLHAPFSILRFTRAHALVTVTAIHAVALAALISSYICFDGAWLSGKVGSSSSKLPGWHGARQQQRSPLPATDVILALKGVGGIRVIALSTSLLFTQPLFMGVGTFNTVAAPVLSPFQHVLCIALVMYWLCRWAWAMRTSILRARIAMSRLAVVEGAIGQASTSGTSETRPQNLLPADASPFFLARAKDARDTVLVQASAMASAPLVAMLCFCLMVNWRVHHDAPPAVPGWHTHTVQACLAAMLIAQNAAEAVASAVPQW